MKLFKLIKKSKRIAVIMASGLMTMTALAATTVSTLAWFSHMNAPITGVVESGSLDLSIGDVYGYKSVRQADENGNLTINGNSVTYQKYNSEESGTNTTDTTEDFNFDVPTEGVGYYMLVENNGQYRYSNNTTTKMTEYDGSNRAYAVYQFTTTTTSLQFREYNFETTASGTSTVNRTISIETVEADSECEVVDGNVVITLTNETLGWYKVWFDSAKASVGLEQTVNPLGLQVDIDPNGRGLLSKQPKKAPSITNGATTNRIYLNVSDNTGFATGYMYVYAFDGNSNNWSSGNRISAGSNNYYWDVSGLTFQPTALIFTRNSADRGSGDAFTNIWNQTIDVPFSTTSNVYKVGDWNYDGNKVNGWNTGNVFNSSTDYQTIPDGFYSLGSGIGWGNTDMVFLGSASPISTSVSLSNNETYKVKKVTGGKRLFSFLDFSFSSTTWLHALYNSANMYSSSPSGMVAADGDSNLKASRAFTANLTITYSSSTSYSYAFVETCVVTLNKQSGTGGTNSVDAVYGQALASIDIPSLTGYSFQGYFTETGGSGTKYYDSEGSSVKNWSETGSTKTLYAKWTPATYTVTLHTNGGDINSGDVTSYTYGVGANLPQDISKEGNRFDGWYANSSLTGDAVTAISTTATGNKEYWAKWTVVPTYTVTIARDETGWGTVSQGSVTNVPEGTTYSVSDGVLTIGTTDVTATPTARSNQYSYSFTGWDSTSGTVDDNMTITAVFGRQENSYTVVWKNGDTTLQTSASPVAYSNISSSAYSGSTPTKAPTNTTVYTFSGWSAASYNNSTATFSAQFDSSTRYYSVTLSNRYGTGSSSATGITYNGAMPAITLPTRDGYTFAGYFTQASGSGDKYYNANGSSAHVYNNNSVTELYAHWISNSTLFRTDEVYYLEPGTNWLSANQRFAVLLYNGGISSDVWVNLTLKTTGIYTFSVPTGAWTTAVFGRFSASDPDNNFEEIWSQTVDVSKSGTKDLYSIPNGASTDKNVKAEGEWYNTLRIIFNKNGGSGTMGDQYMWHGSGNLTSNIYTRTNPDYNFAGWNTSSSAAYDAASNIADGGSVSYATFTSHSVDLYAVWDRPEFTISFNKNDRSITGSSISPTGTMSSMTNQLVGSNNISLTANSFELNYYEFLGWSLNKNASSATWVDSATATSSALGGTRGGTVTIYAIWRAASYSISYSGVGGATHSNPTSYTVETAAFEIGDASKPGYTFDGWTGSNGEVVQKGFTITPASLHTNLSYTAHFTVHTWTITLNANGGTIGGGATDTFTHTYGTAEDLMVHVPTPANSTYVFAGWYDASSAGNRCTAVTQNLDEIKTYYAQWVLKTNVFVGGDTYYLDADFWKSDSPDYYVRLYGGPFEDTVIKMSEMRDNIYSVTLTSGMCWTNMEFLRAMTGYTAETLDPENNVYNRASSLTKTQANDAHTFRITDWGSGEFLREFSTGNVVYFKPGTNGSWTIGNHKFAFYLYAGSSEVWVELTREGSSDYLKGTVPTGTWSSIIFVSFPSNASLVIPGNSSSNWDIKTAQTGNLQRGTGNLVCYDLDVGRWVQVSNRSNGWYLIGASASGTLSTVAWRLDYVTNEASEDAAKTIAFGGATQGNEVTWTGIQFVSGDALKIVNVHDTIPYWKGNDYFTTNNHNAFFSSDGDGNITISAAFTATVKVNTSTGNISIYVTSYNRKANVKGYSTTLDTGSAVISTDNGLDITVTVDTSGKITAITPASPSNVETYYAFSCYSTTAAYNASAITSGTVNLDATVYAIFLCEKVQITLKAPTSSSTYMLLDTQWVDKGRSISDYHFVTANSDVAFKSSEAGTYYNVHISTTTLYSDNAKEHSITSTTVDCDIFVDGSLSNSVTFYLDVSVAGSNGWDDIDITNTQGSEKWIEADSSKSYYVAPGLYKITMPEGWDFKVSKGTNPGSTNTNGWTGVVTVPSDKEFLFVASSNSGNCSHTWCLEKEHLSLGSAQIIISGKSPVSMYLGNLVKVTRNQVDYINAGNNYFIDEIGVNLTEGDTLYIQLTFDEDVNSDLKTAVSSYSNRMNYELLDDASKLIVGDGTDHVIEITTTGRYTFYVTAANKLAIASVPVYGNGTYIMPYNGSTTGFNNAIKMPLSNGQPSYRGFIIAANNEQYYVRSYLNTVDSLFGDSDIDISALKNNEVTKSGGILTFQSGKYNLQVSEGVLYITAFAIDDFFKMDPLTSGLTVENNYTSMILEVECILTNDHAANLVLHTTALPSYLGVQFYASATRITEWNARVDESAPYKYMRQNYFASLLTGNDADTIVSTTNLPANHNENVKYYAYIIIDYVVTSGTSLPSNSAGAMSFTISAQQA